MQFHSADDFQFFPRHWERTSKPPSPHGFTLATYNILADIAMKPIKGYDKYVPLERRYMDYRLPRILKELKELNTDLVCLQEVEASVYSDCLLPHMTRNGYEGVFLQREDDLGQATFFKSSKIELIDHRRCVLHDVADDLIQNVGMEEELRNCLRRHIARPSAMLLSKVRLLESKKEVTIGNIHALWSTTHPDVVLLQVACAVRSLSSYAGGPDKAQILTGDFNSEPDSAVYHLLKEGGINRKWIDKLNRESVKVKISKSNGGQDEDASLMDLIPATDCLSHTVPFKSAYSCVLGREPVITNHDGAYFDDVLRVCYDYIWFHGGTMDVSAVLDVPPDDALSKYYSLPSPLFPSDHLPLKAELLLK